MRRADDPGFTLVEILVAIVLVGILAAVVVVGIGNMTDHASAATCAASADAARTATTSYLVNNALYPAPALPWSCPPPRRSPGAPGRSVPGV